MLAVTGAVLAACGAPGHEYVRNTDLRAAFKIPTAWNVFSEELVLGLPEGPRADTPDPIKWFVGIDGHPEPSATHVLDPSDLAADHPKGFALIQELSFVEHDDANLNMLRNFMFPVDQLVQDDSDARILAYDDTVRRDEIHGIHLEFQFREAALAQVTGGGGGQGGQEAQGDLQELLQGQGAAVLSPAFVQVSQTALLDANADRLYVMLVLCSAECYARNRADIQSVVDSWTVLS